MGDLPAATQPRTGWPSRLLRWIPVVAGFALALPIAVNAFGEWQRARATSAAVEQHLNRAYSAADAGRFEQAHVAVRAARALAPGDPNAQRAGMVVAVTQAARQPTTIDDGALAQLDDALLALAATPEALSAATRLVAEGQLLERRGDAPAALAKYDEATKSDPTDAYAQLALAQLHRRSGRRVEALAAFEAAVAADPTNVTAQNNLGVLYVELERVDDSVGAFTAAIATRDNVASRMNLATTLAGAKRLEEAVDHLQRAIQLAPRSAAAYRQLGQVLSAGGRHREAEQMLLRSLNLKNDVDTGLSLARLYQVQGRDQPAVEVLSAILEARPEQYDAAYALGVSLRRLARDDEAAAALRLYVRGAERVPGEQARLAEVKKLLAGATSAPAPAPSP